jgi:hypothetical protein
VSHRSRILAVRAGVARERIEPALGTPVGPWGARRHHDAVGRHSELTVTALALAPPDGGEPSLVVAADVVLWPGNVSHRVRAAVAERCGTTPESVQLAGSHTHSSVMMDDATMENWEHDGACAAARLQVEERTVRAAELAVADMRPAHLDAARRLCPVTRSRRQTAFGRMLVGIADPIEGAFLDVIGVSEPDGSPIASVVAYGSHPTVLAWASLVFSPDYVGALREVVETGLGGRCLFLQGCGADRAPARSFSNDASDADSVGRAIGYAAVAAMLERREAALEHRIVRPLESGAPLAVNEVVPATAAPAGVRSHTETIDLPLRERDLVAAVQRVARARETLAGATTDTSVELARAVIELDIAQRFPEGDRARVPVSVVEIGPIALVFWPGELAGAYEQLCQASTGRHLILATNANDYVNYLPAPHQFAEGGYEVDASPFAPGAGERFISAITRLVAARADV